MSYAQCELTITTMVLVIVPTNICYTIYFVTIIYYAIYFDYFERYTLLLLYVILYISAWLTVNVK